MQRQVVGSTFLVEAFTLSQVVAFQHLFDSLGVRHDSVLRQGMDKPWLVRAHCGTTDDANALCDIADVEISRDIA